MASHLDDGSQLLIRCPSCGQRFKVGVDLRGRTVECGSCEHRFKIADEVIVRGKKFYPGERDTSSASRYHRVPIAVPPPDNLKTIQYAEQADASSFEPVSPVRLIAGAAAALMVVLMALLLFFGSGAGGALDGIPMESRLALGAFVAVVSGGLLVFANPRARKRAILGALACAGLLVGIPLSQPDAPPQAVETNDGPGYVPPKPQPRELTDDEQRLAKLREEIGTEMLEQDIRRLQEINSPKSSYGVWMRQLGRDNAFLVWEFLRNEIDMGERSHAYPRGRSDYLMLLSELDMDLEDLANKLEVVGEVVALHKDIGVVELVARPDTFMRGELTKLTDPDNPAFYELNKRELDSIDLTRVREAVTRLMHAEPKQYRSDISRRLVALLRIDGVDFKEQVCEALLNWQDPSSGAGAAAEALIISLSGKGAELPLSLVELAAREKRESVLPLVFREWRKDFSRWEHLMVMFGPPVEALLLAEFGGMDLAARKSSVVLLGRVGGRASLELFASILPGADKEMRVRIEQAQHAITSRLAPQE